MFRNLIRKQINSLGRMFHSRDSFEVRSSPNKGLGVFATDSIPYAATIMKDPFTLMQDGRKPIKSVWEQFTKLPPSICQAVLKLGVDKGASTTVPVILPTGQKIEVQSGLKNLLNIIRFNGASLGDQHAETTVLALNMARINHSCVPNAEAYLDNRHHHVLVRALTPIKPGQEITISYINHILPRRQRHEMLRKWDFSCKCPACDDQPLGAISYEKHRRKLRDLQQDLLKYTGGTVPLNPAIIRSEKSLRDAATQVQRAIDILVEDYSLRRFYFQMYMFAFDVAMMRFMLDRTTPKLEEATRFFKLCQEFERAFIGHETEMVQQASSQLTMFGTVDDEELLQRLLPSLRRN